MRSRAGWFLYKEANYPKLPTLGSTNQLTTPTTFLRAPTTAVLVNTKTMTKLLFCLLVALATAQQWEDYEYNDYDPDLIPEKSDDLESGLWREEAVFLTPQDREKESTR